MRRVRVSVRRGVVVSVSLRSVLGMLCVIFLESVVLVSFGAVPKETRSASSRGEAGAGGSYALRQSCGRSTNSRHG